MTAAEQDVRTLLIPGQCDIREYGTLPGIPDAFDDGNASDTESDVQDGVRRIEAVARTWSKWGLVIAYLRLVGFEE